MFFLDTSALVKLYAAEKGSSWIRQLPVSQIIITTVTYTEVCSALARRIRESTITPVEQQLVLQLTFQ